VLLREGEHRQPLRADLQRHLGGSFHACLMIAAPVHRPAVGKLKEIHSSPSFRHARPIAKALELAIVCLLGPKSQAGENYRGCESRAHN
jgi:hypothetical protein